VNSPEDLSEEGPDEIFSALSRIIPEIEVVI
jgi:hypothetical protein